MQPSPAKRVPAPLAALALAAALGGCAAYTPPEAPEDPFAARARTGADGPVRVSAAVLDAAESERRFAAPLAERGIQPVWLEIVNDGDDELVLNLLAIDDDYFSPSEAAWRSRQGAGESGMSAKVAYFDEQHVGLVVGPRARTSGFVYTRLDPAFKPVTVELLGERSAHRVEMILEVPGFVADFDLVDFDGLYPPGAVREVDLDGLRAYLAGLPCCAGNGVATAPLNVVLVGGGSEVLAALVRRGWEAGAAHEARGAAWSLYDRAPDAAFARSRPGGTQRNELRLWMAPVRLGGDAVWVGQVARTAGPRGAGVEPLVDEARLYLLLDLYNGRSIARAAFAAGAAAGPGQSSDGLRAVLFVPGGRFGLDEIEWLDWEELPRRPAAAAPGAGAPS